VSFRIGFVGLLTDFICTSKARSLCTYFYSSRPVLGSNVCARTDPRLTDDRDGHTSYGEQLDMNEFMTVCHRHSPYGTVQKLNNDLREEGGHSVCDSL